MPLYLEFLFILCANFLPFLVLNTWSKKLWKLFRKFLCFLWKNNKNDKHIILDSYIIRSMCQTVASGVDNSNSMDVVIAKKKKKRKEKKRLAKLKTQKGGLGKN